MYEYSWQCVKDGKVIAEGKKQVSCFSRQDLLNKINDWNRVASIQNKMGTAGISWLYYT